MSDAANLASFSLWGKFSHGAKYRRAVSRGSKPLPRAVDPSEDGGERCLPRATRRLSDAVSDMARAGRGSVRDA